MILFDLLCSEGHAFEAWFRDSVSFDRLAAVGEIQCAVCGDTGVRKALMAPNISTTKAVDGQAGKDAVKEAEAASGDEKPAPAPKAAAMPSKAIQESMPSLNDHTGIPVPEKVAEAMRVLREVQTHIEKNFDHVGKQFAEEARKMHFGETEKRSIYGQATKEEAEELSEEGIEGQPDAMADAPKQLAARPFTNDLAQPRQEGPWLPPVQLDASSWRLPPPVESLPASPQPRKEAHALVR